MRRTIIAPLIILLFTTTSALATPWAPDTPPGGVHCWAEGDRAAIAWEQRSDADHVLLIRHTTAGDLVVGRYPTAPGVNQIDLSAVAQAGDHYSLREEAQGGYYGQYGPYPLVSGVRLPLIAR